MISIVADDMRWPRFLSRTRRWPWQFDETPVIELLDEAISQARAEQLRAHTIRDVVMEEHRAEAAHPSNHRPWRTQ